MQAKLSVLDDDEGVALLHVLEVGESNLLDESRHTGVDRCNLSINLCVVGVFHVASMVEMAETPAHGSHQEENNHYII